MSKLSEFRNGIGRQLQEEYGYPAAGTEISRGIYGLPYANCPRCAGKFAHGTDGHNLRMIVAKLAELLDATEMGKV